MFDPFTTSKILDDAKDLDLENMDVENTDENNQKESLFAQFKKRYMCHVLTNTQDNIILTVFIT